MECLASYDLKSPGASTKDGLQWAVSLVAISAVMVWNCWTKGRHTACRL